MEDYSKTDISGRFLEIFNYLLSNGYVDSGRDFTQKLNVTPSYITEIRKNRSQVGTKVIQTLSSVFKINVNWILTGTGEMFSEELPPANVYKPKKNDYDLKDRIVYFCKKKGFTIKELVEKIPMTEGNIYLRFKKNSMEMKHLQRIAEILGEPIENFTSNNIVSENKIIYQVANNNSRQNVHINNGTDLDIEKQQIEIEMLKKEIAQQNQRIEILLDNIQNLKKIISLLEKEK